MASALSLSLSSVKLMATQLLSSRAHLNHIPSLLSLLSSSSSSSSPPPCLLEALLALQSFFTPLLRSGQLSPSASKAAQQQLQEFSSRPHPAQVGAQEPGVAPDPLQAEAIYKSWLWEKYSEFLEVLLGVLNRPEASPSLQVSALDAVMEFIRLERQGEFSNRIYRKLCSVLVLSKNLNSDVVGLLVAKYFQYSDVCYYTYINMEKLITLCHGKKLKDHEVKLDKDQASGASVNTIMCNIYDILSHLTPKIERGKDSKSTEAVQELWSRLPGSRDIASMYPKKDGVQQDGNFARENTFEKIRFNEMDIKNRKSKMSKTWLSFLRLPLPLIIYKKVLSELHKIVLPCLTNPILLSDFLTNSYNLGGVVSVLALNGLFTLITQYGLEYPDFYNKLYALLEPSIFMAKHRARFFELLDTCLKSSHLPSYLAAAFAKKLGRMALSSPPSGALIVIALIHNLLRRHASINCLVHWQDYESMESPTDAIEHGQIQESRKLSVSEGRSLQERGGLGVDPFIACQSDTAECNALKSSLWEMESLRRHYCPAVSRFVTSLETDLTVRAKTTEVTIKDFSSGSYATIFSEEVGKRMKQVPLSFYKSIPTSLFPQGSLDQCHVLGEVDFPGWRFGASCKVQNRAGQSCQEQQNKDESVKDNHKLDGSVVDASNFTKRSNQVKRKNGEDFGIEKSDSLAKKIKKRG